MKKVAVVFWSGTGNTEIMAQHIAQGAKDAGAEIEVIPAGNFSSDQVNSFDSIAFGCPSMGAEELEDFEFLPMWNRVSENLGGKTVALFGSYGWGDGEWMRLWQAEAEGKGINLVQDGLMAHEEPDDEAQNACQSLGQKLA